MKERDTTEESVRLYRVTSIRRVRPRKYHITYTCARCGQVDMLYVSDYEQALTPQLCTACYMQHAPLCPNCFPEHPRAPHARLCPTCQQYADQQVSRKRHIRYHRSALDYLLRYQLPYSRVFLEQVVRVIADTMVEGLRTDGVLSIQDFGSFWICYDQAPRRRTGKTKQRRRTGTRLRRLQYDLKSVVVDRSASPGRNKSRQRARVRDRTPPDHPADASRSATTASSARLTDAAPPSQSPAG